jgi:hypothetical protein
VAEVMLEDERQADIGRRLGRVAGHRGGGEQRERQAFQQVQRQQGRGAGALMADQDGGGDDEASQEGEGPAEVRGLAQGVDAADEADEHHPGEQGSG